MLNKYAITIDVDWMPDWAIAEVAKKLVEKRVKATWFATHDSKEIRKLERNTKLFEVGIHPNFKPRSTQGETHEDVMEYMKSILPHAKTVRTHASIQSNSLLRMIREDFDIPYDVSLFLPDTPYIIPHKAYFSNSGKGLIRFPYYWEDDREMYKPEPCFSFTQKKYHVAGLKIFCFHVIHIILNSQNMKTYKRCKEKTDMLNLTRGDLHPYVTNQDEGSGTLFREVLNYLSTDEHSFEMNTISELAHLWEGMENQK